MSWQPKTAQPVTGGTWQPKTAQPLQKNPRLNQDLGSQIGAAVLAAGQGFMPVFDEAGAAVGAALEKAGSPWPAAVGDDNSSYGDVYEKRLANIRGTEKAFGTEHSYLDPALRVSGAIAGTLATPGLAAASAARPVATGAALGAAQGYTGAEGGSGNRVLTGAVGGGLGAATAYGAKLLSDRLTGVGKNTLVQNGEAVSEVPFTPSGRALGEIRANLQLAGITPEEYAARLAQSTADDFAGELGGENLRMLAQSKAKVPGVSMDAARQAMRGRIDQAHSRVNDIISDAIASPDDLAQRLAQIEGKKAFESAFYDRAKSEILPSDLFKAEISTPAGQAALKQAAINLANRNVEPSQLAALRGVTAGEAVPIGGGAQIVPELPVPVWHEVSKALGDQVKRDIAGNITEPASSAPIESLRTSIVSALRKNSPAFDAAQTNAAQMRSAQDALGLGRKLARIASGETGDAVLDAATRSVDNLPYAQAGYAEGLRDVISGVPYGGNPASRLANPRVVERTAELVGAEKANNLNAKLLAEKLRMDFANRGLNNSATAETLMQGLQKASDIPTSGTTLASKSVDKLLSLWNSGNDRRVGAMLYATSPEEKAALAALLLKKKSPEGFGNLRIIPDAQRRAMAGLLLSSSPAMVPQIGGALVNGGNE